MACKNILKDVRKRCLLSQSDFADAIGVSFSTVNRWENGRAIPNYKTLKKIKEYVEEVVGGAVNSHLRDLNKAKSDIDYENAAIDRMQAQAKEQIEVAKSGDRYTAAKAASDANRMEDSGKKG